MSKKDQSPSAYGDVKYVMDLALDKPGLRYELTTPGRAINFKQRCNKYRNLLREMAAEMAAIPGHRPETAYDCLVIKQQNLEGVPDRKGTVLVFDHHKPEGRIIDPETGEEIEINVPGITDSIIDQGE